MRRGRRVTAVSVLVLPVVLTACSGGTTPTGFATVGSTTQAVVYEHVPSDGSSLELVVRSRDSRELWCDSTQPISPDQPVYSVACNGSVADRHFLYLLPVRGVAPGTDLTCTVADGTALGGSVMASAIEGVSYEVVTADQPGAGSVTSCTV